MTVRAVAIAVLVPIVGLLALSTDTHRENHVVDRGSDIVPVVVRGEAPSPVERVDPQVVQEMLQDRDVYEQKLDAAVKGMDRRTGDDEIELRDALAELRERMSYATADEWPELRAEADRLLGEARAPRRARR